MRPAILLLFAATIPATVYSSGDGSMPADAAVVGGMVFVDVDGDGRRDAGEPGLADVALSNGRALVRSGLDGRYRIDVRDGDTLFLVKPPGYAVPRRDDGLPDIWRHQFASGSPALRYGGIGAQPLHGRDFALRPAPVADAPLQMLLFGDPQPKTLVDVGHFERDIVEPLLGSERATVGLSLGDIVDDDLALYPSIKAVMARLRTPWLHVPGNHDLDFDATDDAGSLHSFRAAFGPDTYAWEEPQASIIVLDDVIYRPGQWPPYIGGLREDQFAFVEAYLATLEPSRPLLLAVHIPFFDAAGQGETFRRADRERLFALLRPFAHVLLLSAHSHAQQHYFHGEADGWHGASPLHEYNVGTTCGGYWGGVPDAAGIPEASMSDGTPNGYARLSLAADGDYSLRWHVARDAGDAQIALHAPKVLRRGAYPGTGLYANVFMGMRDSRVEFRIDGGDWQPMSRVERADPRILAENLRDDAAEQLRGYDRLPEATPSTHLWRANLPTDLAVGEHRIDVRAFDRWRGEVSASTHYRLDEVRR